MFLYVLRTSFKGILKTISHIESSTYTQTIRVITTYKKFTSFVCKIQIYFGSLQLMRLYSLEIAAINNSAPANLIFFPIIHSHPLAPPAILRDWLQHVPPIGCHTIDARRLTFGVAKNL